MDKVKEERYENYLSNVAHLRGFIVKAKTRADAKILAVQTSLKKEIEEEETKLLEIEKDLTEFALMNKDIDFKEKKTLEFTSGKISIKKAGNGTIIIADETATIAKLRELKLDYAIKVEESVKKNAIKDMPNLEELGCVLKPAEDKVYIDINETFLTSTGLK